MTTVSMTTLEVLRRIVSLLIARRLGMRWSVAIAVALELSGIVLGVAGPYVLKLLVDLLSHSPIEAGQILVFVFLFVLTWSGSSITSALRLVYTSRIQEAMVADLNAGVMRSQFPEAVSARNSDSGHLLGLLERLPFSLQIVLDGLIWRLAPLIIQVVASLAVIAAIIPPAYGVVMAVLLVAYLLVTWRGATDHHRSAQTTNAAAGAVSRTLADVARNARRVVLNGALETEVRQVQAQLGLKRTAIEQMSWSLVRLSAMQYAAVGGGLVLLLGMGGLDVAAGKMTVGDFVLLQAYAFRLALPLSGFGYILSIASVSIANIRDVLTMIRPQASDTDADAMEDAPARIELQNISFSYGEGLPGIDDISTVIPAGSFVVFAGPNGSGKSTLAQIIAGLLEPGSGEIRINGASLSTIRKEERHRHILYVPQYVGLFNRTLAANGLYPPTVLSEAELSELLTEWQFHEPGRAIDFSTLVGEQGERLSGGQVQKLELARLSGVRVPVVILDETTSALDGHSEWRAIQMLRKRYAGHSTLILISHRQRSVETADLVLFMQGGHLVAQGRHEELVQSHPDYARLWAQPDTAAEEATILG